MILNGVLIPGIFPKTRERVKQLALILELCGTSRMISEIHLHTRMNSTIARERVNHLLDTHMLLITRGYNGGTSYVRTEKGSEFLRNFAELEELVGKEQWRSLASSEL